MVKLFSFTWIKWNSLSHNAFWDCYWIPRGRTNKILWKTAVKECLHIYYMTEFLASIVRKMFLWVKCTHTLKPKNIYCLDNFFFDNFCFFSVTVKAYLRMSNKRWSPMLKKKSSVPEKFVGCLLPNIFLNKKFGLAHNKVSTDIFIEIHKSILKILR